MAGCYGINFYPSPNEMEHITYFMEQRKIKKYTIAVKQIIREHKELTKGKL